MLGVIVSRFIVSSQSSAGYAIVHQHFAYNLNALPNRFLLEILVIFIFY